MERFFSEYRDYSVEFFNGKLISFENKLCNEKYSVTDNGYYFELEDEVIELIPYDSYVKDNSFIITCENGEICWDFYPSYLQVYIKLTKLSSKYIERVGVLNLFFENSSEIHLHDDCSLWHCPLCEFVRFDDNFKGGISMGLAYPYWETDKHTQIEKELAFAPYVKADEEFISEKAFITPYVKEGRTILSHGPYPGKRKQKYTDIFNGGGGLGQHFDGNKIPEIVDIPDDELDTGEIRAMRSLFRYLVPESPLPEEGYFVWQNGWWAGLNNPNTDCFEPLSKAGIRDVMTAATYFGHSNHPSCEPAYITDTLKDPLRFPVCDSTGVLAKTCNDGHHHIELAEESSNEKSYISEFIAPKDYENFVTEAKKYNIYATSFSTPNNTYANYPEWIEKDKDGNEPKYFGTRVSCPACKEYMEHHFNVLTAVIDKYMPRFWGFDGRWISFYEFGGYGNKEIREDPCYAENHGHLPGKGQYMEWVNIREFKKKLRKRYPHMCLEQYYGLKRGSTFSLEDFNCDENYYEVACPDDNRFQAWHNENDRFRPTYMNFASISGDNPKDFEYAMVSCISLSSYAQVGSGYHAIKNSDESIEIFKFWKSWADKNIKYLKNREFLFGCPGDCEVDGSAHIIDNDGYIFLFNTIEKDAEVTIGLGDIYGLKPSEVNIISRDGNIEKHTPCGTIDNDKSITILTKPHTFTILEIKGK